jgi:hypothetical protein
MLLSEQQRRLKGSLMIVKAGSVFLVLICALLILPPSADADSITMRLLGLKDFEPAADDSWVNSEAVDKVAVPAKFAPSKRIVRVGTPSLLLGYPEAIASHRKVTTLPFSEFEANSFSRTSFDETTDGRRSRSKGAAGEFGAGHGGGGYGGLGSTAYGRTLRSSLDSDDSRLAAAPAEEGFLDRSESSSFAPFQRLGAHNLSEVYGSGGGSGSVLDDQLGLSLESSSTDLALWNKNGPGIETHSAVSEALTDNQLEVPQMGQTPLLDVKPWVSGFTPNAVDQGQFVVVDPVTGTPVWTSAPLDELLDKGSLTPLVPTWEGPDPSLANIPNPEPASLILFASGLLTVGAKARAKYRRSKNRS